MIKQSGESYETNNEAGNGVRLGFHEIIPGLSPAPGEDPRTQDTGQHIPEFNLERQMMALHRRATAAKRKGPGQHRQTKAKPAPPAQDTRPEQTRTTWPTFSAPRYNAVIADIVARDLTRLCGGKWRAAESA